MKVLCSTEGATAARFAATLGPMLLSANRLDCLVLFAIRGDERLPGSLVALLGTLTGQRAAFVIIGDYSRAPDASHPVAHGLREWAEPEGDNWITWVDAPVQDEHGEAARIAAWAADDVDGALIGKPPLPMCEDDVLEAVRRRLGRGPKLDLSDQAGYDRSFWGRLSPDAAIEIGELLAADESIEVLNLGWVESVPPVLVLPPRLRVFRARGLSSVERWLDASPPLEELVLVGGALPHLTLPKRTSESLCRVVLDKNSLTRLPDGIADAPLTILSLFRNNLGTVPGEISRMRMLQSLTIGANPLTTLPEWLAELPALTAIDLDALRLDLASGTLIHALRQRGVNVRTRKATLAGSLLPHGEGNADFPRLPAV